MTNPYKDVSVVTKTGTSSSQFFLKQSWSQKKDPLIPNLFSFG